MALFRRRSARDQSEQSTDLVVRSSAAATVEDRQEELLERSTRAIALLGAQSAELGTKVVELQAQVDLLASALIDRLDAPGWDDLRDARQHTSSVAAEVARLEVNVAARLEAMRADLRTLQGTEIDLRAATPVDTGWDAVQV